MTRVEDKHLSERPDAVQRLFLLSAFVAPLELRVLGALTVYDLLILATAGLLIIARRRITFLPRSFAAALYGFFLFALLSTFRSVEPTESLTQILQFIFIFVIQLPVVLSVARSRAVVEKSIVAFFTGALVVIGSSFQAQSVQGAGRVLTFFSDNANRLAYPTGYLAPFALFFAVSRFRAGKRWLLLLLSLPVAYLLVWSLAASGSRSGTVAALVSVLVFLVFQDSFRPGLGRLFLRGVAVVALVAALGAAVYYTDYFPATLKRRVERTAEMDESLVDDRTSLATAAWSCFLDSPLIGVGLDNFRHFATKYNPYTTEQSPHNMWLQFLAQIGLVGTIMFFIIIARWYGIVLRSQVHCADAEERRFLMAFIASMTGILTIYLFLPIMIQRQYWLIFGLGLALAATYWRSAAAAQAPRARA